ncbi:MAG TPA: hypothetical protein VF938_03080 [Candidatus Angelobacter sp.]
MKASPQADSVPPLLPGSEPPVIGAAVPSAAASPPPLPAKPNRARNLFAILLSLGLGLFLADAVVSLVDNSLILFFNLHVLSVLQEILCLFPVLTGIVIYGLMGLRKKFKSPAFVWSKLENM